MDACQKSLMRSKHLEEEMVLDVFSAQIEEVG